MPALASSALFSACRFVLSPLLSTLTDATGQSLPAGLRSAIVARGGVVDAELDPGLSTHLVIPPPQQPWQPDGEGPTPSPEEVRARNSRRTNVVYPQYVSACVEQGKLLTRQDDARHALLAVDFTALQAKERERAERYADWQLLDVDEYLAKHGTGTYDPADKKATREMMARQAEHEERQQAAAEKEEEEEGGNEVEGGEDEGEEAEEDDSFDVFPVASLTRRSNLRVGQVVRIAVMEGATQQAERRARWQQRSTQADGGRAEKDKDNDDEQKEMQEEGDEEDSEEAAEGEGEEEDDEDEADEDMEDSADDGQGEVDNAKELSSADVWENLLGGGMASVMLPGEGEDEELRTRHDDGSDPDHRIGEKAFVRIVKRVPQPDKPRAVAHYIGVQLTPLRSVLGSPQYSRFKLDICNIIAVTPLYALQDCEEMHAQFPDTFHIPSLRERLNLHVGASIKCVFMQENEEGVWGCERMWLTVVRVDRPAAPKARTRRGVGVKAQPKGGRGQAQSTSETVKYRAVLENVTVSTSIIGQSVCDELTVEPRHIAQLM